MTTFESIAAEYVEQGFAIIRNAVPPALIAECREHVEWLMRKYPALRPEHLHHPLIRNDAFWARLVSDSRLVDIAEYFLGPDLACFTAHYICKPPRDGHPVLWHQDGAYWDLDPMEALTVWLAVDESTIENGCLRMIPKSHRLPLSKPSPRTDFDNMLYSAADDNLVGSWLARRGEVTIELEPGDVSIHHPNLLHCSGPNTSSKRRCGLDIGYLSTSTSIRSDGLYMNPLLVRGSSVDGVNEYRQFPQYDSAETIPFAGHDGWNERVSAGVGAPPGPVDEGTPFDVTQRMISRLREGTVKR